MRDPNKGKKVPAINVKVGKDGVRKQVLGAEEKVERREWTLSLTQSALPPNFQKHPDLHA